MSNETRKIFYLHTPAVTDMWGKIESERASIACTIEDGFIKFGYAICSKDDNFSKSFGREKAVLRMENDLGKVAVKNGWFEYFPDENAVLLEFATTLAKSMRRNFNKYKRKLEAYKMSTSKEVTVLSALLSAPLSDTILTITDVSS